jgi:site-specific recombinase XerD
MKTSASSKSELKLLDRLRQALRSRHYSKRTEKTYAAWVKRFIYYHNVRHPAEMAEPEINKFLTHLAVEKRVSASTQNQALSALLFLYRHVIGRECKISTSALPRSRFGMGKVSRIVSPCSPPLL